MGLIVYMSLTFIGARLIVLGRGGRWRTLPMIGLPLTGCPGTGVVVGCAVLIGVAVGSVTSLGWVFRCPWLVRYSM